MQQEDEEAGDVVVGVGVQSQIHETVHAAARPNGRILGISRSPISISLQRPDTHETLQAVRLGYGQAPTMHTAKIREEPVN
jgi:hypothetical protein